MKVTIKTAHGYLSVQPDGRLEFREQAGPWEEFDVDGLTLAPVQPGPTPNPNPEPPSVDLPPFPAFPAVDYVAKVKAWLLEQGKDLSGPCGAFLITSWVIWGLRDRGAGSLSKPGGNNCRDFATDIVFFSNENGAIVDILSDGGGTNGPTWNRSAPGEKSLDLWRAPEYPG